MRDGIRVFDTDTHIEASAESLEKFVSPRLRELLPDRQQRWVARRTRGYPTIVEKRHSYQFGGASKGADPGQGQGGGWGRDAPRYLGEAAPREGEKRRDSKFMGTKYPSDGAEDWDPSARLKDMDEDGVDVAVMVPGMVGNTGNIEVDLEFVRANHRYLDEFCSRSPARLKSLLIANGQFVEESVQEIRKWGRSRWAVGVYVALPLDYPLDHPDLNPIWKAACDENLCIAHHVFWSGYPGYRDLWSSPYLGRTASHPWAGMRTVGAFIGGGIMERYPTLRLAILESGFGWLPFWAKRLDDQVEYIGYVSPALQGRMSDYLMGGRFFAAIVLHEGGEMVEMVSRFLGDHVLMFSSDYPHPETRFADSVNIAWRWGLERKLLSKIMWENPIQCFGEP